MKNSEFLLSATLRKRALKLIRLNKADTPKVSLCRKRNGTSCYDDMRMNLILLAPLLGERGGLGRLADLDRLFDG